MKLKYILFNLLLIISFIKCNKNDAKNMFSNKNNFLNDENEEDKNKEKPNVYNVKNPNIKLCANCKEITTKRCSGCELVYYCDKNCQRKDWKRHKKECKTNKKKNIFSKKNIISTRSNLKSNIQNFCKNKSSNIDYKIAKKAKHIISQTKNKKNQNDESLKFKEEKDECDYSESCKSSTHPISFSEIRKIKNTTDCEKENECDYTDPFKSLFLEIKKLRNIKNTTDCKGENECDYSEPCKSSFSEIKKLRNFYKDRRRKSFIRKRQIASPRSSTRRLLIPIPPPSLVWEMSAKTIESGMELHKQQYLISGYIRLIEKKYNISIPRELMKVFEEFYIIEPKMKEINFSYNSDKINSLSLINNIF